MSKAVMLSIRPKWCEKIASGEKTIEVRKSRPKITTPFRCYIYCTKDRHLTFCRGKRYCYADDHTHNAFDIPCNGTIIGEFMCNRVDTYDDDTIFSFRHEDYARWNDFGLDSACMHPEDFQNYADGKWLYGWHISDLKIYDKPAADVAPVVHGVWIPVHESEISGWNPEVAGIDPIDGYICSACKNEAVYDCNDKFVLSDYCPRCGARMDGDSDALD